MALDGPKATVHVYRKHNTLVRWCHRAAEACLGKSQHIFPVVRLDVSTQQEAQDRVQTVRVFSVVKSLPGIPRPGELAFHPASLSQGVVEAVLYFDSKAACGRKGHVGFVHK